MLNSISVFSLSKSSGLVGVCFVVALIAAPKLLAHHGAVTNGVLYNTDEIIELEGEMTEVFWHNPHTRGRLRVVTDTGEEEIYEVELGPGPRSMEARYELTAEDFIGNVKVAGYPVRRREHHFGALNVLLPSGEEFVSGASDGLRWANESLVRQDDEFDPAQVAEERRTATSIFRSWRAGQGTWVEPEVDLSRDWLTDYGRELNEAYDILEDNIELAECRQGMPDATFDPVPMQIRDLGDRVEIESSEYNTTRTIYLDSSATPDPEFSATGFSTGRWVGDTLVVTTTHIDWPYWSEWGLPQSEQATVVETYAVSEGGNRLDFSVTVMDPVIYTRPFTLSRSKVWTPGLEITPYECVVDWEEG